MWFAFCADAVGGALQAVFTALSAHVCICGEIKQYAWSIHIRAINQSYSHTFNCSYVNWLFISAAAFKPLLCNPVKDFFSSVALIESQKISQNRTNRGRGSSFPHRSLCRYWSPQSGDGQADRKCTGHSDFQCSSHRRRSTSYNADGHPRIPWDILIRTTYRTAMNQRTQRTRGVAIDSEWKKLYCGSIFEMRTHSNKNYFSPSISMKQ